MADRAPRILSAGEVIDLGGGRRVRYLDTPHVPHGWEAGVMLEEGGGTLLCGDLFTQLGDGPALTEGDVVGPAITAEDLLRYSSLSPGMGATIRRLAGLAPRTLALCTARPSPATGRPPCAPSPTTTTAASARRSARAVCLTS